MLDTEDGERRFTCREPEIAELAGRAWAERAAWRHWRSRASRQAPHRSKMAPQEELLVGCVAMEDFSTVRITLPRLRGDLVQRPRLRSQLVQALARSKLVLLSAAAGYGKTVALVQALSQLPAEHAVAWVSASDDDDLQRLLASLLEALDPFDLPWRVSPEALPAVALREGGLRGAVNELANGLAQAEPEHGVMVFDDVHRFTDPRVFDFFERLLAMLPSKWTVAMTSRTDPPLPLARMTMARELAEFREDELSFERESVQALLQAAQQPVTPERVEQLLQRTQGWAVGLSLELLTTPGRQNSSMDARRRTFEYLAQEVRDQLPSPMQQFLLRCSVLPELTVERCRQVSGDARAAHWLDELERRGLFVAVLNDESHTLRLHDLFREFLEAELTREHFDEVPQLLKRAAVGEPDVVRRVDYLLRAGAAEEAAQEVFNAAAPIVHSGRGEQLIRLIERFPEPLRFESPELAYVRGLFAGHRFEFTTMLTAMRDALGGFEHRQQTAQALQARGLACIALFYTGRSTEGFNLWDRAARIETNPAAQIVDAFIAFTRSRLYGPCQSTPHELWRIVRLIPEVDLDHWVLHFHAHFLAVGRSGMRAPLWALVNALLGRAGESRPQLRLAALRLQAWLVVWEGNIDAAMQLCKEVSAEAQWLGNPPMAVIFNQLLVAFERHLSGDYTQAKKLVEETFEAAQRNPQRRTAPIFLNLLAGLATAAQDWSTAQQLLIANDASNNQPDWPFLKLQAATLRAELLLHERRHAEAVMQLRPLLDRVLDRDNFAINPRFRVALARAELGAGAVEAAWEALAPALQCAMDAGEPLGLLLCGPTALLELADALWPATVDPAELVYLRNCAMRALELRRSDVPSSPPVAPSESPLSDRELQLLELVAQGKSNKTIARTLSINPHTVKRHMARIFDKTGQSSRERVAAWHRSRTLH